MHTLSSKTYRANGVECLAIHSGVECDHCGARAATPVEGALPRGWTEHADMHGNRHLCPRCTCLEARLDRIDAMEVAA